MFQPTPLIVRLAEEGDREQLSSSIDSFKSQNKLFSANHAGFNSLHMAVKHISNDHLKCLKILLSADKDLIFTQSKEQFTPLMLASAVGNERAVTLILKEYVHGNRTKEITVKNIHGENALYLACEAASSAYRRNEDPTKFLLTIECLLKPKSMKSWKCSDGGHNSDVKCIFQHIIQSKNKVLFEILIKNYFKHSLKFEKVEERSHGQISVHNEVHFDRQIIYMLVERDWADGLKLFIDNFIRCTTAFEETGVHWLTVQDDYEKKTVFTEMFRGGKVRCLKLLVENYDVSLLNPVKYIKYEVDYGLFWEEEIDPWLEPVKQYPVSIAVDVFWRLGTPESEAILRYVLTAVPVAVFAERHRKLMGKFYRCVGADRQLKEDVLYAHSREFCSRDNRIMYPSHPLSFLVSNCDLDCVSLDLRKLDALIVILKECSWHFNHEIAHVVTFHYYEDENEFTVDVEELTRVDQGHYLPTVSFLLASRLVESNDSNGITFVMKIVEELLMPMLENGDRAACAAVGVAETLAQVTYPMKSDSNNACCHGHVKVRCPTSPIKAMMKVFDTISSCEIGREIVRKGFQETRLKLLTTDFNNFYPSIEALRKISISKGNGGRIKEERIVTRAENYAALHILLLKGIPLVISNAEPDFPNSLETPPCALPLAAMLQHIYCPILLFLPFKLQREITESSHQLNSHALEEITKCADSQFQSYLECRKPLSSDLASVPSLQEICRGMIRSQLQHNLMFDEVSVLPYTSADPSSLQVVTRSVIDSLDINESLKQFLKYNDILPSYALSMKRFFKDCWKYAFTNSADVEKSQDVYLILTRGMYNSCASVPCSYRSSERYREEKRDARPEYEVPEPIELLLDD